LGGLAWRLTLSATRRLTFDDQQTNAQALTEATQNAGYPSTLVKDATR